MSEENVSPGRIVGGRYRLDSKLGEGGMGSVWRGEHLLLRTPVAVKVIDSHGAKDPSSLERFGREAHAAAALRSAHVVQILDYGVDGDFPYIVMELLTGETLEARLKRVHRLSVEDTARIMGDVARAVGKAHDNGIVHRDLSPANIFLVRDHDQELAKVLDFGLAHVQCGTPEGTGEQGIVGTPLYMSPEQARGGAPVDWRTDLWTLGVVAFECLTGRRPFEADRLAKLLALICDGPAPVPSRFGEVPPGLDAWFTRALCRDPAGRFRSAREMFAAFSKQMESDESRPALVVPGVDLPRTVHDLHLVDSVLEKFRSPDYQPPTLSRVALQLLELARRPDVDFKEISAFFEEDALIAGRVLRVAQSAARATRNPVRSLHDCLVRLGLQTVTEICLEVSAGMRLFQASGYERPMDELRRHSTATARVSRIACRVAGLPGETAFLCGLMHDVGMAAMMIALTDDKTQVKPPNFLHVWPSLLDAHERASRRLCEIWKLPEEVVQVVGCHHDAMVGGPARRLAAAVSLAEALAARSGFPLLREVDDAQLERARLAVGIPPDAVERIAREAAPELADIA